MAKKVNSKDNLIEKVQPDKELQAAMDDASEKIKGSESAQNFMKIAAAANASNNEEAAKPTKKSTTKKKTMTERQIIEQGEKDNSNPAMFMSERQNIVRDMKAQFNEFVPMMNIDLNNIEISDSLTTMEQHTNLDIVFNSKPTFEVALTQSCYGAFLTSMKYDDIDSITNSTMDEYHTTLKMYQIIHDRMQATTVGSLTFDTFINCTSYFDLPSLYYGLHMQTFPGTTKFDFECKKCGHKFSADVPNDSFVFSRDDKVFERLDEIRRNANDPQYIIENSLISKHERVCLNESKTIVDIRIPTLKNQLDILHDTPSGDLDDEKYAEQLANLLFIKKMYILNAPESMAKKKPVFIEVVGNNAMINVIKQLSIADSKQLAKAIEDWTGKYKVEYKIKSFDCPNCKVKLGDMPIDIEQILFRLMLNL